MNLLPTLHYITLHYITLHYIIFHFFSYHVICREADPKSKPQAGSGLTAAGTTNKAEYFQKREDEMKERQRQREEKKKKYSGTGMKMTAEIMAGRS